MVGIVRNATMTFSSKKELKKFNERINQSTVNISRKELQKRSRCCWNKDYAR